LVAGLLAWGPAQAATPGAGTVSPASRTTQWTGVSNGSTAPLMCPTATSCDSYQLTVQALPTTGTVTISVGTAPDPEIDFDLYVYLGDKEVGSSAKESTPPEVVVLPVEANAATVTYRVVVVPYSAPSGTQYEGKAALAEGPPKSQDPAATPTAEPPPAYANYAAPGLASSGAEPTIGVNHKTNNAMFQQGLDTARVSWDDSTTPPTATWKDVSPLEGSVTSLDPIVEVDPQTGRTIVSQLLGVCSASAVSDDDGATWRTSSGCPQPHGADHQTLGAGPRSPARPAAAGAYPNAMYYCSQSIAVTAFCGASNDGGQTFGTSVPIYDFRRCTAIHGHVQVAPDGTVYVPNERCDAKASVVVSEDGGQTWQIRNIPDSTVPAQRTHPAVAIGKDGTVYFTYRSGDGNAMVAVSQDKGKTWTRPVDVAAEFGLENTTFPVVIAGDGDRAAYAFLGTTTAGNPDLAAFGTDEAAQNPQFVGPGWHLYVSHTYDRGQTWVTSDVTPTDPVQRGCLSHAGTTGGDCRDLLDFNGISVDREGRVLIAYADGCLAKCVESTSVADNSREDSKGTIARLSAGRGLFSAFDGALNQGGAPIVCAIRDEAGDARLLGLTASVPTLDLRTGATAIDDRGVVFTIGLEDLGAAPPPFVGLRFDWAFVIDGVAYELRGTRLTGMAPSARFSKGGVVVPEAAKVTFDDAANTVTFLIAPAAFGLPVTGDSVVQGSLLQSIAANANGGGLIYDTAGATCAFSIAGASRGAAAGTSGTIDPTGRPGSVQTPPSVASESTSGGRLPATGLGWTGAVGGPLTLLALLTLGFRRRSRSTP